MLTSILSTKYGHFVTNNNKPGDTRSLSSDLNRVLQPSKQILS